eukprot:9214811-Alexandrium_andersonii.AAC.1
MEGGLLEGRGIHGNRAKHFRGRGNPAIICKPPSWARLTEKAPAAHEDGIDASDMPTHGKSLVLLRSVVHMASISRRDKHAMGEPWSDELQRQWLAVTSRSVGLGLSSSLPKFVVGQTAWHR